MTLYKRELPELEFPLDYPACLDRILKAAENRADYEIAISFFKRMLTEKIENDVAENNDGCYVYTMSEMLGFGSEVSAEAKDFFSSLTDSYRPSFDKNDLTQDLKMNSHEENRMCVCECGEKVEFTSMERCTECDDLFCSRSNHFNLCEFDETICNVCV